jgi:hypothetical protein
MFPFTMANTPPHLAFGKCICGNAGRYEAPGVGSGCRNDQPHYALYPLRENGIGVIMINRYFLTIIGLTPLGNGFKKCYKTHFI